MSLPLWSVLRPVILFGSFPIIAMLDVFLFPFFRTFDCGGFVDASDAVGTLLGRNFLVIDLLLVSSRLYRGSRRLTTDVQALYFAFHSISEPSSSVRRYLPSTVSKDIRSSEPHPGGGSSLVASVVGGGAFAAFAAAVAILATGRSWACDYACM